MSLNEVVKGDRVYVECYSSMGASSTGINTVTSVSYKYDENTGVPYKVITVGGSTYDARNGEAITGSQMYYIEEID